MSTPIPTDPPAWATLAQTLASIDVSLKTIADFVQLLHTEKTGEQVYEVQRYVVGSDGEGQPCVWLYATHPGLNFAVTRVYHDHLHKLPYPFNPNAKTWDGEVAPSAEAAAKKGYFNAFPAPFSISLMPTGKVTDAGHPVRRLHRILDAPLPQQQPTPAAQPKPANGNANGNGKPPARPIQPPEPPPWDEFEDEFKNLPPAVQQPAPAAPLKPNGNPPLAPKPATPQRPPWAAPDDFDDEWEHLPSAAQQPAQARALAQAAASRPAPAPTDPGALPFDSQYTAIKWAVGFAHYQKPDGSGDYPHAAGSHAKLCKQLNCSDKALDCWGRAWYDHVISKAEKPAF